MAIFNIDEFAILQVLNYVIVKQNGVELGKQQGQVFKEAFKNQIGENRLKDSNKKLIPFIEDVSKGIIQGLTE